MGGMIGGMNGGGYALAYVGQERTKLNEVPLSIRSLSHPLPSLPLSSSSSSSSSRFKLEPDPSISCIAVSSGGKIIPFFFLKKKKITPIIT